MKTYDKVLYLSCQHFPTTGTVITGLAGGGGTTLYARTANLYRE